jgi:hypothetical protein
MDTRSLLANLTVFGEVSEMISSSTFSAAAARNLPGQFSLHQMKSTIVIMFIRTLTTQSNRQQALVYG